MISVNRAWLALALVCVGQSSLGAQASPPNGQVVVLDHVFHGDTDEITLVLRRKVLYRAELYGPGALTVESQRSKRAVFLVPIGDTTAQPRRFELYALANEPHLVRITGLPPGDSASLRILRDSAETERIAEKLDRSASFGVLVAAGAHTGYRLDPTGGSDPKGASDVDACMLLEVGDRLGTCLGVNREAFPDARYTSNWLFLEERIRVGSRRWLHDHTTELAVTIRLSKGISIGPRRLDPDLVGAGVQLIQRLSPPPRRRGWRVFLGWAHSVLRDAPETEFLDVDCLTAGLMWVP
jgi:hypothetical protein